MDTASRCWQVALLLQGRRGLDGSFLSDPSQSWQLWSISGAFWVRGGGAGACPAAAGGLQSGLRTPL